ncbi:MAG: DUF2130 domain-containing protein [Acidobacteriia bacterium]|nr:DUF2130 domain-containing protein [Terriglobia bacterium]
MLHETTITCPSCNVEFPLTETLAQPLIAAERAKIQRETQERASALNKHEQDLSQRRKALEDLKRELDVRYGEIDAAVEQKLRAERDVLAKAAEKKAADAYADRLLAVEQELADKQAKLAKAENAELALRKERRTLEEEKQRLELEIERRLQAERLRIREATQKEEEQTYLLKLAEKDKLISDMKTQVEELRRKGEQNSQLQGEVLELELEAMLRAAFPADQIEPVPKGRNGGDVVHKVVGPNGLQCGTILWESKRTRSWSNEWLIKNREDQRLVGAHVGAIVTTTMPKGVDTFDRLEGVWVAAMRCTLPLAKALRHALVEAAMAKVVTQGKDGKMERLYEYLIGPLFRNRVSAIVEACVSMQDDLEAEKRALTKHWAKRARRLEMLMNGTAGMYGDLQGLAGRSMPELHGLQIPQLGEGMDLEPSDGSEVDGD